MKNKEIKRLLNSAAQKTAPDVLDSVLSGCEQQKGRNFVMTNATTSESPHSASSSSEESEASLDTRTRTPSTPSSRLT